MKDWKGFLLMVTMFFLLSACGASLNSLSPQDALLNRVKAYWDARVQGSAEKAYQLLEPEARERTKLSSYAYKTGQSEILSYEIQDVEMDLKNQEALVQVKRSFKIKPGVIPIKIDKILEQTGKEKWVVVNGQWYMTYAFPNLDFMKKPASKTN